MATARFNRKRAAGRFKKQINDVLKRRDFFEQSSEIAIKRIDFEAGRGTPLNNSRSFPELKDASVRIRRALKKFNQTGKPFAPGKSNLTFTGQLRKALVAIPDDRGFTVQVGDSRRRPIRTKKGRRKNPPTNQEVDFDLRDRGFFLFTPQGVKREGSIAKRLKQLTLRFLRRALRQQR